MLNPSHGPGCAPVVENREPMVPTCARRKPPLDLVVLDIIERASDEADLLTRIRALYAETPVDRLISQYCYRDRLANPRLP